MVKASAGGGWSGGGVLLIWTGVLVIEMVTVLVLVPGAAADSLVFGRMGTSLAVLAVIIFAVVAAAFAWRGVSGPRGVFLAVGQFVGAALVLVLVVGFFGGDGTTASSVAPLLFLSVLAEAMIGVGVLHSARRSSATTRGR